MMIDFALEAERDEGKSPREAIHQACLLRFRPIMMTTVAALLGGLPLALGSGTGAELRRPLGITIVGGPAAVAGADAVHDPGHLPLHGAPGRALPEADDRSRGAATGRRCAARSRDAMNISAPFIRRPIATSLLAAAVILAGLMAYRGLPVAPLPRVDFPTISVSAALPGANPDTMASSVATPLERRFGRIAGLTEMTSINSLGSTSITMQFDLDRDVTAAARDVQAAINASLSELPPNLPEPAELPQGQPGRLAHPDPVADVQVAAAGPGVRRRQQRAGAEDVADQRRRAGVRRRRPAARRARADRRRGAGRARAVAGRRPGGAGVVDRQPAQGDADRRRRDLQHRGHRPAAGRGRLPAADRRRPRTARPSGWATWRMSSTTSRTTAWPAGSTASAAC